MIYADSGIIMRWVEGAEEVRNPIESRWRGIPPADRVFVTSRLARLECRCKPLRDRQDDLLRLYDVFFSGKEVDMREIDAAVVEKATGLRGDWPENSRRHPRRHRDVGWRCGILNYRHSTGKMPRISRRGVQGRVSGNRQPFIGGRRARPAGRPRLVPALAR